MPKRVNHFEKEKGGAEGEPEGETKVEKKTPLVDGSRSEQIPFQHVDIHVEGEAQKVIPKIPVGAFDVPDAEKKAEGEEEVAGGIPEDMDLDSLKSLLNSGINIPSLYVGTWWIRTPEQIDLFTTELFYYCQKKGINLRDYLFDELPLLLAAINLGGGIYNDYKAFKKAEKEKEEEEEKDDGKKE